MPTVRVDQEVADELYRRRRYDERNHNGVIRRALDEKEAGMELMVCTDGSEVATVPLRDGDDPFNAAAERGALDRAYEAKESCPDAVVTIVVVGDPVEEREWMEARFDVTDLTADERGQLALEVQAQAERSDGHPDVGCEIEWVEREPSAEVADGARAYQQGVGEVRDVVGGPILTGHLAENFGDDPFGTTVFVVDALVAAALAPEHADILTARQVVALRAISRVAVERSQGG